MLHETLRLWPIVHYGSFRELVRPAKVKGAVTTQAILPLLAICRTVLTECLWLQNGATVDVPAGTCVQIPHYSVHHSEASWGPTVNEFDPDRDFRDKELWGETRDGKPLFRAWNPRSERFFPFQSAPRQCLGMNYAQMVMRVMLTSILRTFDVTLAEQTEGVDRSDMSVSTQATRACEFYADSDSSPCLTDRTAVAQAD